MLRILLQVKVSLKRYKAINYAHIVFEEARTILSPMGIIFWERKKKGTCIAKRKVESAHILSLEIGLM